MAAAYARRAGPWLALALSAGCGPGSDRGITQPMRAEAPSLATSNFSAWSEPANLGATINSTFNELQPSLSKDGLTLFFASNRPEHADDQVLDQNIWVSQRACTDCDWAAAVLLGPPINSPSLEAAASLSRDEHWLFFTSNRPGSDERDIYVAYRENVNDAAGWISAEKLGPGINTAAAEVAPSYFENDEEGVPQLFFNRGAPLGDIYVSTMTPSGEWGPASPVTELNSAGSDQRPSIHHNGLEIYFWSDRSGAARIWQARRETVSDPWSDVMMVPSPIADGQGLHPFIHSRGQTETLLLSRTVGTALDLFVSTRTRGDR